MSDTPNTLTLNAKLPLAVSAKQLANAANEVGAPVTGQLGDATVTIAPDTSVADSLKAINKALVDHARTHASGAIEAGFRKLDYALETLDTLRPLTPDVNAAVVDVRTHSAQAIEALESVCEWAATMRELAADLPRTLLQENNNLYLNKLINTFEPFATMYNAMSTHRPQESVGPATQAVHEARDKDMRALTEAYGLINQLRYELQENGSFQNAKDSLQGIANWKQEYGNGQSKA